jgi:hypothetical protein
LKEAIAKKKPTAFASVDQSGRYAAFLCASGISVDQKLQNKVAKLQLLEEDALS